jgi:YegS/Rv2252/BmrU family lipid kinase
MVIVNPCAGKGYGGRAIGEINRHLTDTKLDFDLVHTKARWHAADLAQQAVKEGYELVVAAGGDGTTNEVVNGLMRAAAEGQVGTLGVIPVGTGSDFASNVGAPTDLKSACHRLANGNLKMVDLGQVTVSEEGCPTTSRYFDNTVNIGFGGNVTLEACKIKRLRGTLLYLIAVLRTVFLYHHSPLMTLEYDDEKLVDRMLMVSVANGPREGGGFYVAPEAQQDDGLLDICVGHQMGRLAILGLIPHFMKGTHVGRKHVTMLRAGKIVVTSDEDLVAHLDGEMLCTRGRRIEFEVLPQRLQVKC